MLGKCSSSQSVQQPHCRAATRLHSPGKKMISEASDDFLAHTTVRVWGRSLILEAAPSHQALSSQDLMVGAGVWEHTPVTLALRSLR